MNDASVSIYIRSGILKNEFGRLIPTGTKQ